MSLDIEQIVSYWQNNSSLTALIPASNCWIDIAADTQTLPRAIFTVISDIPSTWHTNADYIGKLKFQIAVYTGDATTLANIYATIRSQFDWQKITTDGFGKQMRWENTMYKSEKGGAFSVIITYTAFLYA
jgi:hypothetical protein